MKDDIITGLDIGSTAVRIVVAKRTEKSGEHLNDSESPIHVLAVVEGPSEGVSKGVINSIEDSVNSISNALEKAERMAGVPIEHAFVGISGAHIKSQESKGVVAVSKADGEIKEDDVERVIEAAQAVATPLNYDILHIIPRNFTVDGQGGIKDPAGMIGVRLEVTAQIIQGLSTQINNLTKAVYRTGVDIDDLVLSSLAAAEATLTKQQKDLGVALINIGGATSSLIVFEERDVIHTAVIPIGGNHLTSDIAIGLRTSVEVAEKIKLEYGQALAEKIGKREYIDLKEFIEGEEEQILQKHVAEIIEARLEEIFNLIDKELKKIDRSGALPAGIVMTGAAAKLPCTLELAKRTFRLPAAIGEYGGSLSTTVDKVYDPAFSVALGLVLWGFRSRGKKQRWQLPRFSSVEEVTDKMKKWFKSLIP